MPQLLDRFRTDCRPHTTAPLRLAGPHHLESFAGQYERCTRRPNFSPTFTASPRAIGRLLTFKSSISCARLFELDDRAGTSSRICPTGCFFDAKVTEIGTRILNKLRVYAGRSRRLSSARPVLPGNSGDDLGTKRAHAEYRGYFTSSIGRLARKLGPSYAIRSCQLVASNWQPYN